MTIEFEIPNGTMKINADIFFQEANKTTIRKMLKCFKASSPDPEAVQELKDWLQGEIQNLKRTEYTHWWKVGDKIKLTERYEWILKEIDKLVL